MKPKTPPAMPNADTSLWDRIAFSMLGGFTGAAYALVICLLIFGFTHKGHLTLIPCASLVFAGMGFFFGNVVAEAIWCLVYALWGIFFAISDGAVNLPASDIKTHLRYFFLLGIGSGLSFALYSYV